MTTSTATEALNLNHLLILACSASKRNEAGRMPAIDRYDGSMYRVLRNWLSRGGRLGSDALTVWIISGRYGLIGALQPIDDYDRRLTPAFAARLRPALARLLPRVQVSGRVLLAAGRDYHAALPPRDTWPWPADVTHGGIGEQLSQLKTWLDTTVGIWPATAAASVPVPASGVRRRKKVAA